MFIKEKSSNEKYEITKLPCIIGRDDKCDITIVDSTVSKFHAEISFKDQDVFIKDLGSSNSTKVNGKIISNRPVKLNNKDIIEFASFETIFCLREDKIWEKVWFKYTLIGVLFFLILLMLIPDDDVDIDSIRSQIYYTIDQDNYEKVLLFIDNTLQRTDIPISFKNEFKTYRSIIEQLIEIEYIQFQISHKKDFNPTLTLQKLNAIKTDLNKKKDCPIFKHTSFNELYTNLLELINTTEKIQFQLGIYYNAKNRYQQGDYSKSLELLKTLNDYYKPSDIKDLKILNYYSLFIDEYNVGRIASAKNYLQKILEVDPNRKDIKDLLSSIESPTHTRNTIHFVLRSLILFKSELNCGDSTLIQPDIIYPEIDPSLLNYKWMAKKGTIRGNLNKGIYFAPDEIKGAQCQDSIYLDVEHQGIKRSRMITVTINSQFLKSQSKSPEIVYTQDQKSEAEYLYRIAKKNLDDWGNIEKARMHFEKVIELIPDPDFEYTRLSIIELEKIAE